MIMKLFIATNISVDTTQTQYVISLVQARKNSKSHF